MTHIFLVRDEEVEECGEVVIKERSDFCLMNIVLAKCVSLDASSQLDDNQQQNLRWRFCLSVYWLWLFSPHRPGPHEYEA